MIHSPASRRPLFWGTVVALCAALGGQGLMSAPVAAAPSASQRVPTGPAAVSGYRYVERASALDSTSARSVSAPCPSGKVVLAGGAHIVGGGQRVLLRGSYPGHTSPKHEWLATAEEVRGGTPARWYVRAYAVCADKPAGLTYVRTTSASNSSSFRSVRGNCPVGTQLLGDGARLTKANHRVGLNAVTIVSGRSASARAAEAVFTTEPWTVAVHTVCAKPLGQSFRESGPKVVAGSAQSGTALAKCPLGTRAFGAGVRLSGSDAALNRLVPVVLRPTSIPPRAQATVSELVPGTPDTWSLTAQVLCAR